MTRLIFWASLNYRIFHFSIRNPYQHQNFRTSPADRFYNFLTSTQAGRGSESFVAQKSLPILPLHWRRLLWSLKKNLVIQRSVILLLYYFCLVYVITTLSKTFHLLISIHTNPNKVYFIQWQKLSYGDMWVFSNVLLWIIFSQNPISR